MEIEHGFIFLAMIPRALELRVRGATGQAGWARERPTRGCVHRQGTTDRVGARAGQRWAQPASRRQSVGRERPRELMGGCGAAAEVTTEAEVTNRAEVAAVELLWTGQQICFGFFFCRKRKNFLNTSKFWEISSTICKTICLTYLAFFRNT